MRLTAGESNQFMGVLGPDGHTLFFASDEAGTTQIFLQDVRGGGPRLLHDFDGDAIWPKPSPDGRYLLFLFYRDDAAGDACLWDLGRGEMRCLTGPETADLQAFWFPDGRSVGVVQRGALHADMVLRRIPVSGGAGDVVVDRSLSSPAVSPDGRFLAYIPVDRLTEEVGVSFAMRVGAGIEVRRLGEGGSALVFKPDLPGVCGFPAFSADGKWLYFTQYLNDTNGDGTIDGNDHGVLFRIAFDTSREDPFAGASPEQLTSARWSCQYPAPAADRLVMTCSYQGSLDIYSLPLEGAVPRVWGVDRIEAEVRASRDHWERLLLIGRAASLEPDPARRIEWLRRMAHLHLEVREFASATFYANAVAGLAGEGSPAAEWARVLLEVIRHREAEARLVQGQLSEEFVEGERKRLARLAAVTSSDESVRALAQVARAEVLDVLGDEAGAEEAMAWVDLGRLDDWQVVLMAGRRLIERALLLGYRDRLLEICATLSAHPALDLTDRLFFAGAFTEALLRGVPEGERAALVEARLAKAEPGSELRLRLELERWLLGVGQRDSEEVRKGVFDLYKGVKDLERRKALVLTTARRAASADDEYLLYEFTNSFVSWLKRSEPERRHAEDLYRLVILERAYTKWARGEVSDARGLFFGATLQGDILEAHIGAIEARLAEGGQDLLEQYRNRFREEPDAPVLAFVRAYLVARDLPKIADPARHEAQVQEALGLLRVAADAFPNAFEVHHLWGYIAHQRFLRTKDTQAAQEAHTHYLLALDLARDNPRALAALHEAEGLLQSELGNHAGALRHFDRRAAWPFLDPVAEVSHLMAKARSLFHVGRDEEAASLADRALHLVSAEPGLARYRAFCLDRAALYHLSARNFERAADLYEARIRQGEADEGAWNRVKARLGLGASAIGARQFERAIRALGEARDAIRSAPPLSEMGDGGRPRTMLGQDFVGLIAALRAQAFAGLGRFEEAIEEMRARRAVVAERLRRLNLDEDLLDLATADDFLARFLWQAGREAEAASHVVAGLRAVREFEERTGTVVTPIRNRLLLAYGEMKAAGGEAARSLPADLEGEMERVYEFMVAHPNPAWEGDRFLVGLTLGILDAQSAGREP